MARQKLKTSWQEDLKLKLRFLELIFLVTTILVGINPTKLGQLGFSALLIFIAVGALHYFALSNGYIGSKTVVFTAFVTSFSFSAVFSLIFFNLNALSSWMPVFYWFIIGLSIGLGSLPRRFLTPIF